MRFSLLSLILCSTSLICSYVKKVYAKNQDFIDNDTNPDESSLAGTPNHPYIGIPIGTWKITDLNIDEKESLCQKQQNYCSSECGGENSVTKNFCDRVTIGWMCTCQNHVPDVPPYEWPITLSECQGKLNSCVNGCTYGTTKEICIKACNRYFKCNQAGSPPSGLKIEREDQIPNYSLPAGSMNSYFTSLSYKPSNSKIIMKYYTASFIIYQIILDYYY